MNSITTSLSRISRCRIVADRDADAAEPGQLAEILAERRRCPVGPMPPANAQPSVATISATSMRPIRPPQPITPILVSAIARLPDLAALASKRLPARIRKTPKRAPARSRTVPLRGTVSSG